MFFVYIGKFLVIFLSLYYNNDMSLIDYLMKAFEVLKK